MAQHNAGEAARQRGDRRTWIGQPAFISEEPQYRQVLRRLRVRRALTARAQATSLASMAPPTRSSETSIAENLRRVRDRIADAAIKAGRKPEDITLVAVSKTKPVEAIRAALAAGQTVFGENRVQEAAAKFPPLRAEHRFSLHLIGGLQTNKARDAVRLAEVIETLDRRASGRRDCGRDRQGGPDADPADRGERW